MFKKIQWTFSIYFLNSNYLVSPQYQCLFLWPDTVGTVSGYVLGPSALGLGTGGIGLGLGGLNYITANLSSVLYWHILLLSGPY